MGGVKVSLDLISNHTSPVITFLAARLVFFSTLYEADVTKEAVEQMQLVDVFAKVRASKDILCLEGKRRGRPC
jgi:hypothetical protein